jgi:hypothetical protein
MLPTMIRIPIRIRMDPLWCGFLDRIRIPIRIEIKNWIQIRIDQRRSTTLLRIKANSRIVDPDRYLIRIQSGHPDPYSEPDPGRKIYPQKQPKISCFEVLDVLFF